MIKLAKVFHDNEYRMRFDHISFELIWTNPIQFTFHVNRISTTKKQPFISNDEGLFF